MSKRRCSNWLSTYQEWALDRCAAPKSFVFWSAIFCLSSAIRRKVFVPKKILGAWNCYPFVYIFLVGPPGTRKNTAMGFSVDILDQITTLTKPPEFIGPESLIDSISKSDDYSVYLLIEEFGDLVLSGNNKMYEFLTSVFDGKKELRKKTFTRGLEYASKPCVNGFFGTTPKWINENMPEAVIGGGFASRCIFVNELKPTSRRIFFADGELPKPLEYYAKLEKDLVADLQHIANNIEGEFDISKGDRDWFEKWHEDHEYSSHSKLQGWNNRKITYILKLAQLVKISYSDELVLTRKDIEEAIKIVDSIENKLPKVFEGVGKNEYLFDAKDMVEFISNNPGVERNVVLKQFETVAMVGLLEQLIDGLLMTDQLKSEVGSSNRQCLWIKK